MKSLSRTRVLLALAVLSGCTRPDFEPWHEEDGYRWRELRVSRGSEEGFTRLSPQATGITSTNDIDEGHLIENRHFLNGSGVALGDIDGDGWVDVYLSRLIGGNVMYKNLGGWKFEDVTDRAGVTAAGRYSTGAVLADVDGDEDLDLLVTALGGPNALFVNDGAGSFTELTDAAGISSTMGSHTMTLADIDGDGDLDLYVTNYKVKSVKDLFPPDVIAFDRVVQQIGDEFTIAAQFSEHYRLEVQGNRLARLEIGEPDALYLNDGSGRFEAVSFSSGRFTDADGQVLTSAPMDWGLTARFQDADDDGDPDLYVTNDFESADRFWINDGAGHFQLVPRLALRTVSQSSMAVDFSDIDRDGDLDFFTADMLSRDIRRRRTQMALTPADVPTLGVFEDRPQIQRNALFRNRGDGTYEELAQFAGLAASDWSWGSLFIDVDLDGYEDLLIANGYGHDALDGETQRRIGQRRAAGVDWRRDILQFPPLPVPNAAFRNRHDFTFEDVSTLWGFGVDPDVAHGIGSADLDGDGDLDIVLNRQDAPPAVYRNDVTMPRVAVRLKGMSPNTQGVGAKVTLHGGPVDIQTKEVTSGGMYLSGSDPQHAFAASTDNELTIEVAWRSGRRTFVNAALANRLYEITESGDVDGPTAGAPRTTPIFRDMSSALGHRHIEEDYVDFARQPLLPNRLSQLGPGLTWYDVDRDGDEDLLVTSGSGGDLGYLRNDAGRFSNVQLAIPRVPYDQTTVLPLSTASGQVSLLLGQMNYEAPHPTAAQMLPGVIRVDAETAAYGRARVDPVNITTIADGARSTVGPLALADYDGDGDLDLFVGGRTVPGAHPTPAVSRLYVNDAGNFREEVLGNRMLASLGLVSAALFSDIDADGDPDLVLALDWGPVRVFQNDGGRFSDVTDARGLGAYTGRWNGVASGDINGDGLMDLVATNWGQNTGMKVGAHTPLRVYFADFDNNGTLDILEAQQDDRIQGMAPLAPLSNLMTAMPFLQRRIRGFQAFADANLEDLIGPAIGTASFYEANTVDHMLFLNRGDRFEAVPLPWEAQLAPAFYAGVADFDGDGHDDVFLTQNFFPTRPETERHDSGRGLWLRGNGSPQLMAVPGTETGVKVYGDQRGAALADYDRDGRIDLAVSQNGAATVLYHNEGAQTGIRVELVGPPANRDAIGAAVRLVYEEGRGPVRELQAGSGYWSSNGLVQVLGVRGIPTAVWVRWPGGTETETRIAPDASYVVITSDGTLASSVGERR